VFQNWWYRCYAAKSRHQPDYLAYYGFGGRHIKPDDSRAPEKRKTCYEEISSPLQASPRRTARWGLDGSLRSQAPFGIVSNATHYNILSSTIVSDMISGFLA
jgi:hypothetical protein